jgi:hypothetical protein
MSGRTQLERLWMVGAGIVAFAIVAIGYFFFISPQRGDTSSVDGQVSTASSQNDILQARISHLAAQNRQLASYQRTLSQARLALPASTGIPDFLRTLQSIGSATGSDVSTLTVGDPTNVGPATPTATNSAADSNAAATAAPGANAAAPTGPGSGIYSMTISAQVTGSTKALGAFLTQLQNVQPRAVLISQITESTGSTANGAATATASGGATLQISMQAFVALNSALSGPSTGAGSK